jgi:sigma-B regulation protein RsbU (phosphoserine phosphatase)
MRPLGKRKYILALVVDDSAVQRRIVTAYLRNWGIRVIDAANGADALHLFRQHTPDLVISDWMMPGMSGLELCSALRVEISAQHENGRPAYVIMLTSRQEKGAVATGLDAGADDFLMKPVSAVDLRARINAGVRILEMQHELAEKSRILSVTLERLQGAYDQIDRDLEKARNIQKMLIPHHSRRFGNCQIDLMLHPCGHVGGDLVGMFSPNDFEVAFYNIDVSGHGIASALMAARLAGYLNPAHMQQNVGVCNRMGRFDRLADPASVAATLNDRLLDSNRECDYFTMVYARVMLDQRRIQLVQAGHPHPLIIPRTGEPRFVGAGGMPVGLFATAEFVDFEIQLNPGDRLLLYSDGLTEVFDGKGASAEGAGILAVVNKHRHENDGAKFLAALQTSADNSAKTNGGLKDDVSAAVLQFDA